MESTAPDIVMGNESWLREHTLSSEIFPSEYNIYRKDRENKSGGGVFLAVKNSLVSRHREDLDSDCEAVWTEITIEGAKKLVVGSYYHKPSAQADSLINLQKSINPIKKTNVIWLGGDYNLPDINWEDAGENKSLSSDSKKLIEITSNARLEQMITYPTWVTNKSSKILDLFFTSNGTLVLNSYPIPGISDHDIPLVNINIRPTRVIPPPRKSYHYKKAKFENKTFSRYIRTYSKFQTHQM